MNASAGDFRLLPLSPCIDAGNDAYVSSGCDRDGKSRILNGAVDMGCYELIPHAWDTDADGLPDFWEWDYSRTTNAMSPNADEDSDGYDNRSEYVADTDPCDAASILCLSGIVLTNSDVRLEWKGGSWATQLVERKRALISTTEPWVAVFTNYPPTEPDNWLILPMSTNDILYYRIRALRN